MSPIRLLPLVGALLCLPAAALDYQVHGFAAQGYVKSEGNNIYGESTGNGSFEYYEAGLNGGISLLPGLLVSAQVLVRDAGESDNDGLRLDYALVDWQFLRDPAYDAGIRLGRVRNVFGLYNDVQDVIFTRPSILLPQSVYFGAQGFRSVLFTSDGGQLYGGVAVGSHFVTATVSRSRNFKANDEQRRQFNGGGFSIPNDIQFSDLTFSRVMDEWDSGNWRLAVSNAHGDIGLLPHPSSPLVADFRFDMYVASLRHAGEKYAVTAEYVMTKSRGHSNFFGDIDNTGDGGYLQADWMASRAWTLTARYDMSFNNRNDRNGDRPTMPGEGGHAAFAKDFMIGGRWQPDAHWGVWAEQHWIDGTATAAGLDNPGPDREPHWWALLLMGGYRF